MRTSAPLGILMLICWLAISTTAKPQLKFEQLSARDGLADDIITSIYQDKRGFMWFGTYRGLSRYDGYDFVNFQYEDGNIHSLQGNMISAIFEDHANRLWVGSSSNGLSYYEPALQTFTKLSSDPGDSSLVANYSIRVIYEDTKNYLWVGTEYGLSIISPDRKTARKYYWRDGPFDYSTINGKTIYDIAEDKQGRIWIATENSKLCVYDRATTTFSEVKYTSLPLSEVNDNILKNLYFQNDSILWISSNKGGLTRYNVLSGNHHTFTPKNSLLSGWHVRDIWEVDGKLWLAMDGSGLDILDLESFSFSNYQKSPIDETSLSTNTLWTLFKDRQGIIWIGTYQGGINKYDPSNNYFHLIKNNPYDNQSIPDEPVLSLYEDEEEDMWIGTDWGGLHRMPKGSEQIIHYISDGTQNSLSTNVIKSIGKVGNKLLIGTYNHGFTTFHPHTNAYKHYRKEQYSQLESNNIWAIHTDSRGLCWLGTLGAGVVSFLPDEDRFVKPQISYTNRGQNHVYHIYEDSQYNLWFSTDGGVIKHIRRTMQWVTYEISTLTRSKNHKLNQVKAVYEDNKRYIWFATAAGLVRHDPAADTYEVIGLKDGIPELPIENVTGDGYGNLIIISKTYISLFNLSRNAITSYEINDNSLVHNSLSSRSNGELWVGGTKGITTFKARDLRKNEYVPPVYLTAFSLFNKQQLPNDTSSLLSMAMEYVDEIHLTHDQSVFNIEYAALNYSESSRNRFSYKLEGFDQEWHDTQDRNATYTNLDAGEYTFSVKASNNHGMWNAEGASVKIVIHPPFWQSLWFKVLILVLLAFSIYLFQRLRLRQLTRKYEYQRLQNEQEMIRTRNESLERELDSTKSEMNTITMSYLHKNQKLQQIRQKIADSADKLDQGDKWSVKRLIKEIDAEIQDKDYWDKFEHQFNKSHDNFLERFKKEYPDLSKRELRVCAYLRMGLDNHEISILMNVTLRTVEQSRYRIRKKIGLDSRQSFTKMILRF